MSRKKYFCDYCQRSFNDDPKGRALHLGSTTHINLKFEHYQQFKDAKTIYEEESEKDPCFKFRADGFCRFGSSCRFTHLLPSDFEMLLSEINDKDSACASLSIENWWHHRVSLRSTENIPLLSHQLPAYAREVPISLQPFDVRLYLTTDDNEWGRCTKLMNNPCVNLYKPYCSLKKT